MPKKRTYKRGPKTIRISGRIPVSIATAKPDDLSWGEFICRLVEYRRGHDTDEPDRLRLLGWAAVSLDRIACILGEEIATGSGLSLEDRINRLGGLAALTAELVSIRFKLEEDSNANL
jgi:hypothetical protein